MWKPDFGKPIIEYTTDGIKITALLKSDGTAYNRQNGVLNTAGVPDMVDGETYTISVQARGAGNVQFYMMGAPINYSFNLGPNLDMGILVNSETDWINIVATFVYHAPADTATGFELFASDIKSWVEFKKNTLMLTQGTEVIPWEPAPGETVWTKDYADLAARITKLEGGTTN